MKNIMGYIIRGLFLFLLCVLLISYNPTNAQVNNPPIDSSTSVINKIRSFELLLEDGATVSYSENGARQNPWIESVWSRFSVEFLARLRQAESHPELKRIGQRLIDFYLYECRHSVIGYKNPYEHLTQIATEENLQAENLSPN